MNKACLMKLGWELNQNGSGLSSVVLKGKYGRGVNNFVNAQAKNNDSSLWKMLMLGRVVGLNLVLEFVI
jgi:hypothetical protein